MSNFDNYVFHLWTSKTGPLRYLSELLRDLLTEGNLECTSEGMRLMSVLVAIALTPPSISFSFSRKYL